MRNRHPRAASLLGLAALAALAPAAQAQTPSQILFVGVSQPSASGQSTGNTIQRFAAGSSAPTTFADFISNKSSFTGPALDALAFDPSGSLYAADGTENSITKYAGGPSGPSSTGTPFAGSPSPALAVPTGLAFDPRGDLFVANQDSNNNANPYTSILGKFAAGPGGPSSTGMLFADLGDNRPNALIADAKGDVFVAVGRGIDNNVFTGGFLEEFAAGLNGPSQTPTDFAGLGQTQLEGLAFDAQGDLFATTQAFSSSTLTYTTGIVKFTAGAGGLSNTPTVVASDPSGNLLGALAFDSAGNLFVANRSARTLEEFAAGPNGPATSPTVFASFGAGVPNALAFQPVPEASATVSLGLLLALGAGGVIVATRRKKA